MNQLSKTAQERVLMLRYGFCNLFAWALLGFTLEAAHGFKWASYLDDELARYLLRLAHAHGVGLSVVCLTYASAGLPLVEHRDDAGRPLRQLLAAASILMPAGFALSVIGHGESDPGFAIWLVPLGAGCLLSSLGWLAIASIRHTGER
jgi:hypothetical protein